MIEMTFKQIFQTQGIPMNNQILPLFVSLDDFYKNFEPNYKTKLLESGSKIRHRKASLSLSEVLTILVWFHQSGYRTFKHYYLNEVSIHLRSEFPNLVSYSRFVELMPTALIAYTFKEKLPSLNIRVKEPREFLALL